LRESTSRNQRLTAVTVTVSIVFVFLYVIVFPRPLPAEFTLVPRQASSLTEVRTDKLSPGGSFFVLGGWEGYRSLDGKIEMAQPRRAQSAASGDRLAWFDATRALVEVDGPQGPLFTLAGEQYPLWVGGRLFTLDENRLGVRAWGPQGQALWSKQVSSLVTSLDASTGLTVLGTLDGRIQIFGQKGEAVGGFQPGGSRLPVVYNVAISPRDGTLLALAGVDPKRFLILERGGSDFRPVFHKPLKERQPWPTPLGFLDGGKTAYYETDRGLVFLDPKNPDREALVTSQGVPVLVRDLPDQRLVAFVERSGDREVLRIAAPTGVSLLSLPFQSQDLILETRGTSVVLGADQTLLSFEVRIQ
jgi:hypothetical protein